MNSQTERATDLSEEELIPQWIRRKSKLRGIIALKGLPSTLKTDFAELLGEWAGCPVLCIQDFLGGGDDGDDDDQHHLQHAFTAICTVARRQLAGHRSSGGHNHTVVIKSRLNSTFELERLLQLCPLDEGRHYPLVIIECQMNEYQWRRRFLHLSDGKDNSSVSWYRPRSWNDMEKARDDYYDPQARADWDRHLLHLLNRFDDDPPPIRLLVVNPVIDLSLNPFTLSNTCLPDEFINAIKYLLDEYSYEVNQNPYVIEFSELRESLFDKDLIAAASKPRRKYLCSRGDCVFKYKEALDDYEAFDCGRCEERVSGPAYTCHFCILTLHKACAERIDFKALWPQSRFMFFREMPNIDKLSKKHACKSCIERGSKYFSFGFDECRSCLFQTHLKCCWEPTIINHSCHQHFLSILFRSQSYICKACGDYTSLGSYGCKRSASYYHPECVFLPLELKHEHGGHEHVVKLMYSRDGMEPEEDYWCDFCYQDMDPYSWFYSCQECPYYVAHLYCTDGFDQTFDAIEDAPLLEELRSRLQHAIARSSHS